MGLKLLYPVFCFCRKSFYKDKSDNTLIRYYRMTIKLLSSLFYLLIQAC
jgi:hypothetical protein